MKSFYFDALGRSWTPLVQQQPPAFWKLLLAEAAGQLQMRAGEWPAGHLNTEPAE